MMGETAVPLETPVEARRLSGAAETPVMLKVVMGETNVSAPTALARHEMDAMTWASRRAAAKMARAVTAAARASRARAVTMAATAVQARRAWVAKTKTVTAAIVA